VSCFKHKDAVCLVIGKTTYAFTPQITQRRAINRRIVSYATISEENCTALVTQECV
jgi:hypothetical protein